MSESTVPSALPPVVLTAECVVTYPPDQGIPPQPFTLRTTLPSLVAQGQVNPLMPPEPAP